MKKIYYWMAAIGLAGTITACSDTSFKRTESGLLYKIIPSGNKDSVQEGHWLKMHFEQKINDSVLESSFGKMPVYIRVEPAQPNAYNITEVIPFLHKGDSASTVILVDSLKAKGFGQGLPPFFKDGDKLYLNVRVLEVFTSDSIQQADFAAEQERDMPRQMKEQEEMMAKMNKDREEAKAKEMKELEASGEKEKQLKEVEDYLAGKNIKAVKKDDVFVFTEKEGDGPAITAGKVVELNYKGTFIPTDSVFDANKFTVKVGVGQVIGGFDKGLQQFKQGSKGSIFIPGFNAYGKSQPGSPFKDYQPLRFDVEILSVKDAE